MSSHLSSSLLYKNNLVPAGFHSPSPSNRQFSRQITCREMSCSSQTPFPTLKTVTISYTELKDKRADLSLKIEEGFGPNGLGILSITDVPEFPSLRRSLLRLSPRLASLPEEVKKELEDPHSSHGKEKLESGKPDLLKGSFYANPILDRPTMEASLIQRYPSYCGSNIWPDTFKALGKLIFDVGLILAYHCDRYVSKGVNMHEDEGLEKILLRSRCHKGRLLYYFPAQESNCTQDGDSISSWCGWHTDHGSLTGLTCGMFMKDGVELPCPDSAAGLYIKTRTDQIVKAVFGEDDIAYQIGETTEILSRGYLCATPHCVQAVFGEDDIAYQIGETTEILSRGYLCATPHCVQAPKGQKASGIDRSTFALFMQPDWDESLNFPEEVHIHKELISSNGALTFGEYTEKLLDKYYHLKT
ncbi:hypothetical protein CFP56_015070 [Quercus suber]|uniref:Non-haem dioxygenase N-terminal domain-containing protein n=1 Tax=Quercus suber TaxID=58331 RepID=A0AAW0KQJ2_QUESU